MEAKQFNLSGIGLGEKQIAEHLKLYQGYVKKYVEWFFDNINWDVVNSRLK